MPKKTVFRYFTPCLRDARGLPFNLLFFIQYALLYTTHILFLVIPLNVISTIKFNNAKSLSFDVLVYRVEKSKVDTCFVFLRELY